MSQRIQTDSILRTHRRNGAMLIQLAIMMIGLMFAFAFSVNIAQKQLTQTEMHTATQAAARAAAATLADTQNRELARARGQQIAAANQVNGKPLLLSHSDILFGCTTIQPSNRYEFALTADRHNSVAVHATQTAAHRHRSPPLTFSRFFGFDIDQTSVFAAATHVDRDIVLVVDRSKTMSQQDLEDLHQAIEIFTETLERTASKEHVGLVSYSDRATKDVLLTDQMLEITKFVACLTSDGTANLSEGMHAAASLLRLGQRPSCVRPTLIVTTKGTSPAGSSAQHLASSLADRGVQVCTITLGPDTNSDELKQVAEAGQGRHFHAVNASELKSIYRDLATATSTILTHSSAHSSPGKCPACPGK